MVNARNVKESPDLEKIIVYFYVEFPEFEKIRKQGEKLLEKFIENVDNGKT